MTCYRLIMDLLWTCYGLLILVSDLLEIYKKQISFSSYIGLIITVVKQNMVYLTKKLKNKDSNVRK